jgi:hypothetical protein
VTSTPGRRCGENIKGKLPFFLAVLLGFHDSLRRSCIATTAGAPSDFSTIFMGPQLAFLSEMELGDITPGFRCKRPTTVPVCAQNMK